MSAPSVTQRNLLEGKSAFNRVVTGKKIGTYELYKQGLDMGQSHEASLSLIAHTSAANSLELLLSRKKKQFLGIAFSEIVLLHVTIRRNRRTIEIAIQTLTANLLNSSRRYVHIWSEYNRKYKKRINKGGTLLKWFMERKTSVYIKETFEYLAYFSVIVLKILEKIERQYELPHRSLLSQILAINQIKVGNSAGKSQTLTVTDTVEEITVVDAPGKFSRTMTIKKNGYRYLSLLLRRAYLKRLDLMFEWYQRHTMDMRYALHLKTLLERLFEKQA